MILLQQECKVDINDTVDSLYTRFLFPGGIMAMVCVCVHVCVCVCVCVVCMCEGVCVCVHRACMCVCMCVSYVYVWGCVGGEEGTIRERGSVLYLGMAEAINFSIEISWWKLA